MQEKISEQKIYIEKVRKLNEGKNLKYIVLTMGCQLNENDSEKISGMLEEMGYSKTDKIEDRLLFIFHLSSFLSSFQVYLLFFLSDADRSAIHLSVC